MGRIELLARVCGPPTPDLNPCDFYLWGKRKSVVYANNPHDLEALNRIFIITFSNINCNRFPKICLNEFRHVSQQKADILNIFYDGEYNINYYI
jgi:hypothetical protein